MRETVYLDFKILILYIYILQLFPIALNATVAEVEPADQAPPNLISGIR